MVQSVREPGRNSGGRPQGGGGDVQGDVAGTGGPRGLVDFRQGWGREGVGRQLIWPCRNKGGGGLPWGPTDDPIYLPPILHISVLRL